MTAATRAAVRPLRGGIIAEFIGTFALVFFGTGAFVANLATDGAVGHVGVALTFGLVIGTMVYTFKGNSGAQFNPAVSIALWSRGVVSSVEALVYIGVQVVAAVAASAVVTMIANAYGVVEIGATVPLGGHIFGALVIELLTTFTLVTVIFAVVDAGPRGDAWSGIAIGGTVGLAALAFGPISGASMNPARSIGPALLDFTAAPFLWIYLVGPILGGLLAALVRTVLVDRE